MIAWRSDLYCAVDPDGGTEARAFDSAAASACYRNTDDGPTGWYPVGAGGVWHLGVHLWAGRGTPVRSVAPGRIVAAGLDTPEGAADRGHGSRGFVLVRHEVALPGQNDGVRFCVLYQGLTWSEQAVRTTPWLRRYRPGPPPADADEDDGPMLAVLREDVDVYARGRRAERPWARLQAGTIVEREAERRQGGRSWHRLRMHRGQCPHPQRHDHRRDSAIVWLPEGRGKPPFEPVRPVGAVVQTGLDRLRLRRVPGQGGQGKVTTLPERGALLQPLSVATADRQGERWQAVRVRLRPNPDREERTLAPFVPDERGRWAYGWVYDGRRYTGGRSALHRPDDDPAVRRALADGRVARLDARVEGGEVLGAVGPLEADPGWWGRAATGVHLEVFGAPGLADALPGERWVHATDDTDDDIFCDSEQVRLAAEADPDVRDGLLERFYDRAVGPAFGADTTAVAGRRVADVEAFRRLVVRTASPWAMNWERAAAANPAWAEAVDRKGASARELQGYAWWPAAEAAGVRLPVRTGGRAVVDHVHPIAWLEALHRALEPGGPAAYLEDPSIRLRRRKTDGWVNAGPAVTALQRDLLALGFDGGSVDGTYGAATQGAVVAFQVETYYHVEDGRLDPRAAFGLSRDAWEKKWAIDGQVGPMTKAALRAWRAAGLTAAFPRTINVAPEHPGGPMGYVRLDREYCAGGVYHYQSGVGGDQVWRDEIEWWGQPPLVYTLERVCRRWAEAGRPQIQIGDMTRPQGGTYWKMSLEYTRRTPAGRVWVDGKRVKATKPGQSQAVGRDGISYRTDHGTHNQGRSADVRPMVFNQDDVGRRVIAAPRRERSRHYDQLGTYRMLRVAIEECPRSKGVRMCERIYFNDEDMLRRASEMHIGIMKWASNHHHHAHIKV
jgi:hypothetical protein